MPLYIKNNSVISSNDITSTGVFKTKINRDGLILYYDAGDVDSYSGSGNTIYDLSGYGNNGTIYNSPSFSTSNGGNLVFNGSNNYIRTPYNISLKPPLGNTVETFIYIEPNVYWASVIQSPQTNDTHTPNYFDYAIYLSTDGIMHTRIDGEGISTSTGVFNFNVWNQFAITWARNIIKFYLNGVNISTISTTKSSIIYDNATDILIGTNASITEQFKGKFAIARVYNRMLEPFEIAENFQSTRSRFGI